MASSLFSDFLKGVGKEEEYAEKELVLSYKTLPAFLKPSHDYLKDTKVYDGTKFYQSMNEFLLAFSDEYRCFQIISLSSFAASSPYFECLNVILKNGISHQTILRNVALMISKKSIAVFIVLNCQLCMSTFVIISSIGHFNFEMYQLLSFLSAKQENLYSSFELDDAEERSENLSTKRKKLNIEEDESEEDGMEMIDIYVPQLTGTKSLFRCIDTLETKISLMIHSQFQIEFKQLCFHLFEMLKAISKKHATKEMKECVMIIHSNLFATILRREIKARDNSITELIDLVTEIKAQIEIEVKI